MRDAEMVKTMAAGAIVRDAASATADRTRATLAIAAPTSDRDMAVARPKWVVAQRYMRGIASTPPLWQATYAVMPSACRMTTDASFPFAAIVAW